MPNLKFNLKRIWTCVFHSNKYLMISLVEMNPLVNTSWLQWLLAISNSLKPTILFSKKPWSILSHVLFKLRFTAFMGFPWYCLWTIIQGAKNMSLRVEAIVLWTSSYLLGWGTDIFFVSERSFFESWFCEQHRSNSFIIFFKDYLF